MIPTSVLIKIATLGLSEQQAEVVGKMLSEVEAVTKAEAEAVVEKSREKGRARLQKWREKQPQNVTKRFTTLPDVSKPLTSADDAPDLENKQTNKEERKQDSAPAARVGLADFRAELSSVLDTEHIEAICAVRRKKGATFSALAGRGLVKALRACPDITAAADEMVLRNWTGIKPDWLESRSRQNGHSPPVGKRMNAVEAMLSLQAERENEQTSGTIDHRDDELFPPDKPGLPRPVVDIDQAFEWPVRQRDH